MPLIRRSAPAVSIRAPAALAVATALAAALVVPARLGADAVNRVVLRVNDRIATLYDYQLRRSETEREVLRRQDMPLDERRRLLNHLGETVFRDLFEEMLLLSRADQADIQPAEADVEDALARMKQNFGLETDRDFQAALAQTGMSEADLRDQLRRTLRIQTLLGREVQGKIEVDEEVLRRFYRDHPEEFQLPEQLRLREVVVLDDSGLSPSARDELAARLRAETVAGRPLAELAEEHAKDGSTSGLIDIGWVTKGDLSPDLEAAVWGLAAGQTSEPVAARGGLHLVQVEERREAALKPFVEVAEEIRNRERQRLFADKYKEYMDRLEREAFIQADPPEEAKNFRAVEATPGNLAELAAGAEAAAPAAEAAPAPADVAVGTDGASAATPTPGDQPPPPAPKPDFPPPPPQNDGR